MIVVSSHMYIFVFNYFSRQQICPVYVFSDIFIADFKKRFTFNRVIMHSFKPKEKRQSESKYYALRTMSLNNVTQCEQC